MHLSCSVVAETAISCTIGAWIKNCLPLMNFFLTTSTTNKNEAELIYSMIPAMTYTVVYMQLILLLVVTVQKESLSKK